MWRLLLWWLLLLWLVPPHSRRLPGARRELLLLLCVVVVADLPHVLFSPSTWQVDVPAEIPEHDYRSYYSPTYRLELPSAIMEDNNSEEGLAAVREVRPPS